MPVQGLGYVGIVKSCRLMFLRANPRHHSVGLLQLAGNSVHHVMFEVLALDDVGRAYDFAREKWRIGQTLGGHPTTTCSRSMRSVPPAS